MTETGRLSVHQVDHAVLQSSDSERVHHVRDDGFACHRFSHFHQRDGCPALPGIASITSARSRSIHARTTAERLRLMISSTTHRIPKPWRNSIADLSYCSRPK